MIKIKKPDRIYFRQILKLAVPLILQYLLSSSVTLVDNVMVGALGDVSLAAVNICTQFYMRLFHIVIFGLVSGASILATQYWGIHDSKNIHRIMGLEIIVGSGLGVLFSILTAFFPEKILGFYSEDPQVVRAGSLYLSTFSLIFLLHPIALIYASAHRAIGDTKLPMIAIALSLAIKLILNYFLIYGNWGFPKMGIAGAAYATLIAKISETALLLFFTYKSKSPVAATFNTLFDFDRNLIIKTARNVLPVLINETLWGLGTNIYSAIYAKISTTAIAAVSAVSPVDTLMFTLIYSFGDACGILVGNLMGRNEQEKAYEYGIFTAFFMMIIGFLTGVVVFFLRDPILNLYNLSAESYASARIILTILTASLGFRAITYTIFIGVLRAGGDVRFCLAVDAGSIWLIGIPVSVVLAFGFHLPIETVYLGFMCDELFKVIVVTHRLRTRKWMNVLTT